MPFVWPRVRGARLSGRLVCRSFDELLRSLTPYERDCMWKVNLSQCYGEPIDPHAKEVFDDAVKRFDAVWRRTALARWRQTPTVADVVEAMNREQTEWPRVRLG